jgi:hypothetical protein
MILGSESGIPAKLWSSGIGGKRRRRQERNV